jgi:hypothetical protein
MAIRTAVLREPGSPLQIEKLEMEASREHEVLVRLVASGICHTDIDFCDSGGIGPAVLRREGAGVVERLDKSAKGVRVGDHGCTLDLQDNESNRRLSQFGCMMKFERKGIEDSPINAESMRVDNGVWKRTSISASRRRRASCRPSPSKGGLRFCINLYQRWCRFALFGAALVLNRSFLIH